MLGMAVSALLCACSNASGTHLRLTELPEPQSTGRADSQQNDLVELLLPDVCLGYEGTAQQIGTEDLVLEYDEKATGKKKERAFSLGPDTMVLSGVMKEKPTELQKVTKKELIPGQKMIVWQAEDGQTADIICILRSQ
ncbi:MAG: hypothetical protein PHD32_11870 [Eubacteriales bacterium]|nr:hypothetical protein [Eubacteriales bacterium]